MSTCPVDCDAKHSEMEPGMHPDAIHSATRSAGRGAGRVVCHNCYMYYNYHIKRPQARDESRPGVCVCARCTLVRYAYAEAGLAFPSAERSKAKAARAAADAKNKARQAREALKAQVAERLRAALQAPAPAPAQTPAPQLAILGVKPLGAAQESVPGPKLPGAVEPSRPLGAAQAAAALPGLIQRKGP